MPMPRHNPIDVLKAMLLKRGEKINEDSFDEAWFRDEPEDGGLFEAGDCGGDLRLTLLRTRC
jgi:hypothetical protein